MLNFSNTTTHMGSGIGNVVWSGPSFAINQLLDERQGGTTLGGVLNFQYHYPYRVVVLEM